MNNDVMTNIVVDLNHKQYHDFQLFQRLPESNSIPHDKSRNDQRTQKRKQLRFLTRYTLHHQVNRLSQTSSGTRCTVTPRTSQQ